MAASGLKMVPGMGPEAPPNQNKNREMNSRPFKRGQNSRSPYILVWDFAPPETSPSQPIPCYVPGFAWPDVIAIKIVSEKCNTATLALYDLPQDLWKEIRATEVAST